MSDEFAELKKKVNFESTVARCGNCIESSFQNSGVEGPHVRPRCLKHKFFIKKQSLCDDWTDIDGTKLN